MTWWGVGVAAAGVLANVLGNKKAVNAQEEAAKRANDLQLSMYQQQRDDH